VTGDQYEAIYGPGGARDPLLRERLARTRRPGMELVISAHKSVAELGVIGRAEHMHRIMEAERGATLEYLDTPPRQLGASGARGARLRHLPSPQRGRSGDPLGQAAHTGGRAAACMAGRTRGRQLARS